MMAARAHRLHHYIWHQVRNLWWEFTEAERRDISRLGWEPPRKAIGRDGRPDLGNDSGEDFLYMHRVMIAAANAKLAQIGDPGYPRVEGWNPIPSPDDDEYSVPPFWDTGDEGLNDALRQTKSEVFYQQWIVPLENQYRDPVYIREVTLGELGARIEFTVHNWLHMRFAARIAEIRPDPAMIDTDIDPKWDAPTYDWLGDTYASHVNPFFWKLHGWVDDRIDDWKRAHGITGPIPWVGTWIGDMPPAPPADTLFSILSTPLVEGGHDEHHHHHDHGSDMAKVLRILNRSGKCSHFYDHLFFPEDLS